MANSDTQVASLPDAQVVIYQDRTACQDSREEIQTKLLSLGLQQAQIQNRIHILQHAMAALIRAFGPAILCDHPVVCEPWLPAVSGRPVMIDLCQMILVESKHWLTLRQIHETIRIKYPFSTRGLMKPGTAISNALRTLYRHSAVETKLNSGIRQWRSVGEQAGVAS